MPGGDVSSLSLCANIHKTAEIHNAITCTNNRLLKTGWRYEISVNRSQTDKHTQTHTHTDNIHAHHNTPNYWSADRASASATAREHLHDRRRRRLDYTQLKLIDAATSDTAKLSCLCRVSFGGVKMSPAENLKSEHVDSNCPIHTATPDTTQTEQSCRVWRAM